MPEGAPLPRANPFLIGHEEAERNLAEALHSRRLHHAWLITGPKGIGKATLAYRFTRHLLAGNEQTAGKLIVGEETTGTGALAFDPERPLFHRVAAGGHADLCTIERRYDDKSKRMRNEIIVADVRGVGRFMHLTAAEGGWRVIVVDSADEMNRNAANAILKVLEEPPERVLLVLLAHTAGRLPATIRSRCRTLPLNPLSNTAVENLLRRYGVKLDDGDAAALARLSEGSIGLALDLAEQGGLGLYREILALLQTLPSLDIPALHKFAERISRRGADAAYRTAGTLLLWWLGRLVRGGATGCPPDEVVGGEGELMQRLVVAGGLDRWLEVWENVGALLVRADAVNLDRRQVVLSAFFAVKNAAGG
jgi:DNA polymerase-3 subunit delta'